MCVGRMFAIVVTSASPTQCRLTATTQRHSDKATQQHCHQPELIENIVIHERKHGNIMLHVTISHFLHVSTPFFSSHRMWRRIFLRKRTPLTKEWKRVCGKHWMCMFAEKFTCLVDKKKMKLRIFTFQPTERRKKYDSD